MRRHVTNSITKNYHYLSRCVSQSGKDISVLSANDYQHIYNANKRFIDVGVGAFSVNANNVRNVFLLEAAKILTTADGSFTHVNKISPFYLSAKRSCILCNRPITANYQTHVQTVEHKARVAIVARSIALFNSFLLAVYTNGEKEWRNQNGALLCTERELREIKRDKTKLQKLDIVKGLSHYWWQRLYGPGTREEGGSSSHSTRFHCIKRLSSPDLLERRWRIRSILRYLFNKGLLQGSLHLQSVDLSNSMANFTYERSSDNAAAFFVRGEDFQSYETFGDNVIKCYVPDRLRVLFPLEHGGVDTGLLQIQQLLDSNSGLVDIYDYLQLNEFVGVSLPHSKAKADVVEALFGELQCILWSSELNRLSEVFPDIQGSHLGLLKRLVEHAMHELLNVVILWRIEEALTNAKDFLEEHTTNAVLKGRSSFVKSHVHTLNDENTLPRSPTDKLPLLTDFARENVRFPFKEEKEAYYHSGHFRPLHVAGKHEISLRVFPEPETKPPRSLSAASVTVRKLDLGTESIRYVTSGPDFTPKK